MSADGPTVNYPPAVPASPTRCPASKVPPAVVAAVQKGEVETVETWFADDAAADPNALDADGWTLLGHAAHHGRDAVIEALVKRGADVNKKDLHGVSPIAACCSSGLAERPTADLLLHKLSPAAEVDSRVWAILRSKGWIC